MTDPAAESYRSNSEWKGRRGVKWLVQIQSSPWPRQEKPVLPETPIPSRSHWIMLPPCCAEMTFNLADLNCRRRRSYPCLCSFASKFSNSPFVLTAISPFLTEQSQSF